LRRGKTESSSGHSKEDGDRFADEWVETIERRYIDHLSVDIMEMRLRNK
jgi:hypothetical protein